MVILALQMEKAGRPPSIFRYFRNNNLTAMQKSDELIRADKELNADRNIGKYNCP